MTNFQNNLSGIEREPFRLDFFAKRDFSNWVSNQFPKLQKHSEKNIIHPEVEARFTELNGATMIILDLLVDNSTGMKKKNHRKHMINLSFAFEQKDYILYTKYLVDFLEELK